MRSQCVRFMLHRVERAWKRWLLRMRDHRERETVANHQLDLKRTRIAREMIASAMRKDRLLLDKGWRSWRLFVQAQLDAETAARHAAEVGELTDALTEMQRRAMRSALTLLVNSAARKMHMAWRSWWLVVLDQRAAEAERASALELHGTRVAKSIIAMLLRKIANSLLFAWREWADHVARLRTQELRDAHSAHVDALTLAHKKQDLMRWVLSLLMDKDARNRRHAWRTWATFTRAARDAERDAAHANAVRDLHLTRRESALRAVVLAKVTTYFFSTRVVAMKTTRRAKDTSRLSPNHSAEPMPRRLARPPNSSWAAPRRSRSRAGSARPRPRARRPRSPRSRTRTRRRSRASRARRRWPPPSCFTSASAPRGAS